MAWWGGVGRDLSLRSHIGRRTLIAHDHVAPIGLAMLLLLAGILNVLPGSASAVGAGGVDGVTSPPRLVIAGLANGPISAGSGPGAGAAIGALDQSIESATASDRYQIETAGGESVDRPAGPFLPDGTLVMPVTVDTSVADGSDKLITYRVRSGDTLTGVASHFGVTMMSIWWANDLKSKHDLTIGQRLVIPPVTGLVITIADGDTLDAISARTGVSADEIVTFNGLTDRNLIVGQVLIIPGGAGEGISTPKPASKPASRPASPASTTSSTSSIHPPSTSYSGGAFAWPVPGGYISQYYHYSHPAIDIAAPYGSRIIAAAGGTVVFAGWKNNGGGYQVWISHGSGLYTGYYHMSAVMVGTGQRVGRGTQIGRIGQTGWATGPHCHFEVWHGYPWEGSSYRVNPLIYL
jgi:murein DD-endopeptidase MepM/ murein hydrolase activator NlpD